MTRINTNVGSLIGRNNLQRANADLSQSLTRLSTGLRINTGADDPAGLIASENLRSDITSIERAIGNTERAEQVIATADSALGQVSSLLNDIRGLVTESANSGALSQEQIDANQLQVDSSLEALNRIAQTTTFQGRRLLDGSLDFLTNSGANPTAISNVQIDQANLGATGQVAVDVNVTAAATQAAVTIGNLPDVTPTTTTSLEFDVQTSAATGSQGSVDFSIVTTDTAQGNADFTTTAQGSIVLNGETITLDSTTAGAGGNAAVSTLTVTFGAGSAGATFGGGTLAVSVTQAEGVATIDDVIAAIDADSGTNGLDASLATGSTGTTTFDETTNGDVTGATLNSLVGGGQIDLVAVEDGTADGAAINALSTVTVNYGAGAAGATFSGSTLTVNVTQAQGVATLADIEAAIDAGGDINATLASGSGVFAAVNTVTADGDGADAISTTETIDIVGVDGEASNINISFAESALGAGGGDPTTAVIGNATSGYTVQINSQAASGVGIADIRAAIASIAEVSTATITTAGTSTYRGIEVGGTGQFLDSPPATESLTLGADAVTATQTIDITTAVGFAGNFNLSIDASNDTSGAIFVNGDANTGYTLNIDDDTGVTVESIRAAIEGIDEVGSAALGQNTTGTLTFNAANGDTTPATLNVVGAGLGTESTGLNADLVFELAGQNGSEVLTFEAGTTLTQLITGVNAISDATGVTAAANDDETGVVFSSSGYGTDAFVDIQVIDEGTGSTPSGAFTTAISEGTRSTGTDVTATVNGITATGDGNNLSINTATLDLSATLTENFVGSTTFTITGGGALFQLGPDVVSNQQARLGITSVNTAALGGVNGSLFQLQQGGSADLSNDPTTAARIVEEAIDQVTSLRGRLGAFQRTTLETNRNALNDTLTNLSEAESSIRDADFAAETANLTRSQILVQSGTRVLGIANQNPQNVLALLG